MKFKKIFKHFFIFLFFAVLFFAAIFPLGDVADLVTKLVHEKTQKQIFVTFSNLGLTAVPQPGLKLEGVELITPFLIEPLKVGGLVLSPSLLGILSFQPGVSVFAEDIFSGEAQLTARQSGKSKSGAPMVKAEVQVQDLSLKPIIEMVTTQFSPSAKVTGDISVEMDSSMKDQPQGKVNLTMNGFELSSFTFNSPMGPLPLPEVKLKKVSVDGILKDGKLSFTKIQIGESSDALNAQVEGQMDLRIQPGSAGAQLTLGALDITVDLTAKQAFLTSSGFGAVFALLQAFKKPSGNDESNFKFRIATPNVLTTPAMPTAI